MDNTSARETSPLVSVIITTYNRSALLKRAIESVLAQSMPDFELLIVDDCSSDNTEEVSRSYSDSRVKYSRTAVNSGHDSLPKNIGIMMAKGKYICFLDDDDFYRKDALRTLSVYGKETDADVVYGDYLIGEPGKKKKNPGWSIDFSASALQQFNYISMIVAMIKRESLVAVGGFDENVPKFKDWNLWIRMQKAGFRFIHVPIIVAEVESQPVSVSEKFKVEYDTNGRYLPTFFNPVDCKIWPDKTSLGERKPLKVAVYTLTWNRKELTDGMSKSLYSTAGYPFDWFVIDQGSTDGTKEWLKDLSSCIESPRWLHACYVQFNEKNVGLADGWNQAIDFIKSMGKFGEYDIVIKIDNDAKLLTEGWLKAMVDLFERNQNLILSTYIEGLENSPGGVLRQRSSTEHPYFIINETVLGSVPNVGGIVLACHIKLFEDWKFSSAYKGNKDFLLCKYAGQLGFSCFYMEEFRAEHQLGSSGQKEKYPEYFKDASNDSTVK